MSEAMAPGINPSLRSYILDPRSVMDANYYPFFKISAARSGGTMAALLR